MELVDVVTKILFALTPFGVGGFILKLLPLVSDRANERAVRLAKARRKGK